MEAVRFEVAYQAKLTAVQRYEAGYVFEKAKGGLPIPYRCLDDVQRQRLDALIAAHMPNP